ASNRDLEKMTQAGDFRSDLYYRLNVLTITLPPLRDRGDDILLLAEHFVGQTARRYGLEACNAAIASSASSSRL
ncbi:MAG: sigma 54-interacting transcriptional regulator, partial [Calditrichaceae bacterium]